MRLIIKLVTGDLLEIENFSEQRVRNDMVRFDKINVFWISTDDMYYYIPKDKILYVKVIN